MHYSKYDNAANNELTDRIKSQYKSNEFTLYAEDDISLGSRLKLNGGIHYTMFGIAGTKYHSVEPRAAMNIKLCDNASFRDESVHASALGYIPEPADRLLGTFY